MPHVYVVNIATFNYERIKIAVIFSLVFLGQWCLQMPSEARSNSASKSILKYTVLSSVIVVF